MRKFRSKSFIRCPIYLLIRKSISPVNSYDFNESNPCIFFFYTECVEKYFKRVERERERERENKRFTLFGLHEETL